LTGERIDPAALVPAQFRPKVAKPAPVAEAEKKHRTKCAMLLLGAALGDH
jgi:hypothetical protein